MEDSGSPKDTGGGLAGPARVALGRLTEQAGEVGRAAWESGREKARAGAEAAAEKLDEGYRAVSFAPLREHVEQTLEQVVDVLVSFDARLSALERRLGESELL